MYRSVATTDTATTNSGDSVVTLDQVPCWSDAEFRFSYEIEDSAFPTSYFHDPLTPPCGAESSGNGMVSRFPVDYEINLRIYLWRGNPWNLEVDAAVNSTNEVSNKLFLNVVLPSYLFFCSYDVIMILKNISFQWLHFNACVTCARY